MAVIIDPRNTTMDDAVAMFAEYARLAKAVARRKAVSEDRIAKEKAKTEATNAPDEARMKELEGAIGRFVLANRTDFVRPKQRPTDFGKFGLQHSTRIEVQDVETVLTHARDQGYTDMINVKETLNRAALKRRLDAGENIPGAARLAGDIVVLNVDKQYLSAD